MGAIDQEKREDHVDQAGARRQTCERRDHEHLQDNKPVKALNPVSVTQILWRGPTCLGACGHRGVPTARLCSQLTMRFCHD